LLVILRVAQTNQHPWSWARIRDYYRFYWNFWPVIGFLIPIALLIGLWLLLGGRKETPAGDRPSTFRDYEWLAAALFLLAPMAAITGALLIPPHIYVDRYLALSTTGFALLITFAAARWAGPRAAIGIACAIAALAPFLFHFTQIHAKRSRDPYTRARLLRKELGTSDQPVVVSNYIAFLEVWYYAPDDVKPRILCLDDEKAAVKYRHMDDVAGDSLRDIGVPFHPYGEFATSGKQFKIYFVGWSWITNKILEDGGSVEWLDASDRSGGLLRARIK
jgi:hypothetical protein